MSWLSNRLKQITSKRKQIEQVAGYLQTATDFGVTILRYIPEEALREGVIFDINAVMSGDIDLAEIHVKFRIDADGDLEMMEWPGK